MFQLYLKVVISGLALFANIINFCLGKTSSNFSLVEKIFYCFKDIYVKYIILIM